VVLVGVGVEIERIQQLFDYEAQAGEQLQYYICISTRLSLLSSHLHGFLLPV
jgi:hypothetical protein